MPKHILIFSDGTGQVGGLRPDQALSNIYKMYRAMRPGPDSPIKPNEQVCFYDAGLGAEEVGGLTFRRVRKVLAAAVGAGIDENVIDCYEKIIAYYEPGDQVHVFGFSRGAYTARAVANVMNLCGIPTKLPDGAPIPKHGPKLRKIASDAVNYVYNHGNGKPRGEEPYLANREELGQRFRVKYGSSVVGAEEDVQGNVQPTFIGVFDTVAALGNKIVGTTIIVSASAIIAALFFSYNAWENLWIPIWIILSPLLGAIAYWYLKLRISQFKYFSPNPDKPLKFSNPRHWWSIWKNGHRAVWDLKNYDKWLDSDVKFARHALAIDEHRKNFPRVGWASKAEAMKTADQKPEWLKQVWFAGCHSDIGGSYPETESRLSDIALDWMISEIKECVPGIKINENKLVRSGDHKALQHEETYMFELGPIKRRWPVEPREVEAKFNLHPTVIERLKEKQVPQLGEVKQYRPPQLKDHPQARDYYK